jgi:sugar fermentation stimulation protein A
MQYERPLLTGKLIKRYKRFLADIELTSPAERAGEIVTAHCANTGSMTNCKDEGAKVWLFDSQNPKRKLPLSWEWVEVEGQYKACINTARPNQLIKEALAENRISEIPVADISQLKSEPKVDEGRLDFLIESDEKNTYIEVKSVTLLGKEGEDSSDGMGYFPDAVTTRGAKHLEVLMRLVAEGHRCVMLFCVPHQGIKQVSPARHIDAKYSEKLTEAQQAGVEVLAYSVKFDEQGMAINNALPVII